MTYSDIIPRGKYKGFKVADVLDKDPQYILDMVDKKKMYFSDTVLEEAQNRVDFQHYIDMDKEYELKRVFRDLE